MKNKKNDYAISNKLNHVSNLSMVKIKRKAMIKKIISGISILLTAAILLLVAINYIPTINNYISDIPELSSFMFSNHNAEDKSDKIILKNGDETIDYIKTETVKYVVKKDEKTIYENITDDFYNDIDRNFETGIYEVIVKNLLDNGEGEILSIFRLVINDEYSKNHVLLFRGNEKLD